MSVHSTDSKFQVLVEGIELPRTAYESAKRRYDDLGTWFDRPECGVRDCDPHIFVQGSFALGTAIRPVKAGDEYDLDLTCNLRKGITRSSHTQAQLKDLVGRELQAYRQFRNIKDPLEPKNRCWRLNYKDDLPFHLDIVPAIPVDSMPRASLQLLLERNGMARPLAADIVSKSVWITDKRKQTFGHVSEDWLSSNPEGYVRWFVSRMETKGSLLLEKAQVDDVPLYARKSSLQRAIQLLKTHRDVMFEKSPDSKPISIIITTIAARAYSADQSLSEALKAILIALESFRQSNSENVSNPVNPAENFADRWNAPECRQLRLKENFYGWVDQVRADVAFLMDQREPRQILERAEKAWKLQLNEKAVASALGLVSQSTTPPPARRVTIEAPPRPWGPLR